MRNVIAIFGLALLFVVGLSAEQGSAQPDLKKKVDSLFVIASSGELRFRDLNEPAMDSIAALGRPAVPILIDKFITKSARERWTIIWTLERIGSEAVPDLVAALKRPNPLIVSRCAWALGSIKDSTSTIPLTEVCNHDDWSVRNEAVLALGKIGDARASETVLAALSDTIGQVRKSAVVSAGKIKIPLAIQPLVRTLADPFYGARLMAIEALAKFDSSVVIDALADAMEDDPPIIGHLACRLLGQLATPEAIEILHQQVLIGDTERKRFAALALVEADPLDNCGFRSVYLNEQTDRLSRIQIESAIAAATDEQGQP
ncbi:HEAT repeat domain-containing protein [bacterium]|nr:HEAT repeat domain-containing protein [bacterium]